MCAGWGKVVCTVPRGFLYVATRIGTSAGSSYRRGSVCIRTSLASLSRPSGVSHD